MKIVTYLSTSLLIFLSEYEIVGVRNTKERKNKEIFKDSNLSVSKKTSKKKVGKKPKAPFCVSTVEFLSLPNIWSMMEDFGLLRDCWESTEEAYI